MTDQDLASLLLEVRTAPDGPRHRAAVEATLEALAAKVVE